MSDLVVVKVVHRWKQANTSSWFDDAEQLDAESAINYLRSDFRQIKGYKAKCTYLAQIYRNLAGPLETPQIAEYADKIDQRLKDVDQLMTLLQGSDKVITKAEKEFDQLIENIAKGEKLRGGYIEAVYDLPSMKALLKKALEADKIQSRLQAEDNEVEIDWTLEDYLGGEAKIYSKIERNGSSLYGWFADSSDFKGVWALYGFLKYHLDTKYIEDLVESAKSNPDERA